MSAISTNLLQNLQVAEGHLRGVWLEELPLTLSAIGNELTANTSLRVLEICLSVITESEIGILAPALQKNTSLEALSFEGNLIDGAATLKITSALASHPTLRKLDLINCDITTEGLPFILQSLSQLSTLEHLALNSNKCGDEGSAKLIANFLRDHTTINSLGLHGMGMTKPEEDPEQLTDQGVRHIFDALKSNNSLTRLNLGYNYSLTDALIPSIEEVSSLESCQLKKVKLFGCTNISPEGIEAVEQLFKTRSEQPRL